ncbi:hypothetical protein NL676_022974 [Syzygium grande]|nr:hypothetical protein NL676_022974 [Syzygium grande]
MQTWLPTLRPQLTSFGGPRDNDFSSDPRVPVPHPLVQHVRDKRAAENVRDALNPHRDCTGMPHRPSPSTPDWPEPKPSKGFSLSAISGRCRPQLNTSLCYIDSIIVESLHR